MRSRVSYADEVEEMSRPLYLFMITAFTFVGIFISFIISFKSADFPVNWVSAIGILLVGIVGIIINKASKVPFFSFVGYMMIAVPYGFLMGPLVNTVATIDIVQVFFATTIYVAIFGAIGTVIPESLDGWDKVILWALFAALIGYFVVPIVAGFFGIHFESAMRLWDYAIIMLFAGIIVRDFNRAVHMPHTLDNAIDAALDIYLDWFNVAIRLLSSKSSDDD